MNALEAMDGAGALSITTSDRHANDGSRVHIDVADTGKGISDTFMREGLFRPFATTKKKGLGLGLYQCRSIVQGHDGELTVTSELGKGSVFCVSLPAVALAQLQEAGASEPSGEAKEARG